MLTRGAIATDPATVPADITPTSSRPATVLSDVSALLRLADALVASRGLPPHIRNAPHALAVMLVGRELGLEPMASLRSIGMHRGKIVLSADLQLSIWKREGGHAQWLRSDVDVAELELRHCNGDRHVQQFTADDARRAGLWGAPGPWSRYPAAMLRARAVTAALKAIGFALTAGAYDDESEELPGSRGAAPCRLSPTDPATPATLAGIEEALVVLRLHSAEDAERATRLYAARRARLTTSERHARRFLLNLRERIELLGRRGTLTPEVSTATHPRAGRQAA